MSDIVSIVPKVRDRNEDAVECLEKWLEMARSGAVTSVVIVGENIADGAVMGYSRDAASVSIIGGLEYVKHRLLSLI